jgi:dephospho-CoA kinase
MCTDDAIRPLAPAGAAPARARRASAPGAFVLGLVGPAGGGKSMVAGALAADGATVVEADRLGHQVTDQDPAVRAALVADYGADVYRANGTLDRAQVAARVFREPAALARLNQLVHPRIVDRLREAVRAAASRGAHDRLVLDAALLFDWGFERECDAVLAVVAPHELCVARLVRSRGWSEAKARERLAAARSNEEFAALADETVRNDGSEAAALASARAAVARLEARRRAAR